MVRSLFIAAAVLAAPIALTGAGAVEVGAADIGEGVASYYAGEMAGRRTANGETCDPAQFTAAHRTLPFGTRVAVTYPRTGKSVVVRINDRGPFARGRILDMSRAAAREIGLDRAGSGTVQLALAAADA